MDARLSFFVPPFCFCPADERAGVFAMLTVKEMSKGLRGHSAEFADAITLWDI